MISDKMLMRNIGEFSYILKAGNLSGSDEGPFLYHIRGAKLNYGLFDEESFQTMGLNEVFSPQYINGFFKHDFGSLLFKTKHFAPALGVTTAVGYFKGFTRFDTPYLESGLLLQDLLTVSFIKVGIGGFYRYGAHHLPEEKENITYKLTFRFNF
jgi:hypothetical protein